jgi:hypothetical protein
VTAVGAQHWQVPAGQPGPAVALSLVDQVHTLGRGGLPVDPAALDAVQEALQNARIEDAYDRLCEFGWPPLSPAALPSRLLDLPAS